MKIYIIQSIITVFAALTLSPKIHATQALDTDNAVTAGKLDCGLSYYIVTNPTKSGMADFALVSKGATDSVAIRTDAARNILDSLPHFKLRTAMDFLTDNGIHYPRPGYISAENDAMLYHFRDVNLNRTGKIADSTLLLLFDIALRASEQAGISGKTEPEDQAIIVAGDIDKDAILNKMSLISLMINSSTSEADADTLTKAAVEEKEAPGIKVINDAESGLSKVKMVFYGPEIPKNLRGSSIALVSTQFWSEIRTAATIRMNTMLRAEGVAHTPVAMLHFATKDSGSEEKYIISTECSPVDTAVVKSVILSVISDMKTDGLRPAEYSYARKVSSRELYFRTKAVSKENSDYVRKCVSAFLYGSAIVSTETEANFFLTSGLADTTGRRLLNNYISQLFPQVSSGGLENIVLPFRQSDTLLLAEGHQKVKVTKTRPSKTSDGDVWIFSNGMTVVYKKMKTSGNMYYSWLIRGGVASVSDLKAGEGAFYSDMLFQGNICGMQGEEFKRLLAAEGITMDCQVGVADMRISGIAPFNRMTLLMKALLSISTNFSPDSESGQYYIECERQRLSSAKGEFRARLSAIDSIMCPGYRYFTNKSLSGLYPDLPQRSGKFFQEQFAKSNDGVLILAGDLEDYEVKSVLCSYLGDFKTQTGVVRRPSVLFQPVSGSSTYVTDGRVNSIDLVLASGLTMNSNNYMAAQMVTMAVKDVVARTLAPDGMTVNVNESLSVFPRERYTVSISAMPAVLAGLPGSVTKKSYFESLWKLRLRLSGLADTGLSSSEIGVYRDMLVGRYSTGYDSPATWVRMIGDRFSSGKNLDSDFKDRISKVSDEDVNRVLRGLLQGSSIEYVIKKDEVL